MEIDTSPTLGDGEIRAALIKRLWASTLPKKIIEELRVHNGNAIADVVTLHNDMHCYEIKGENDSISRVLQQAKFYNVAFRKITLVTTARHRASAERLAPSHWGIMLAYFKDDRITLKYIRPTSTNPYYDKKLALLTLWRSELAEVATPITNEKIKNLSRASLSNLIGDSLGKDDVSRQISAQIIARKATP